MLPDVSKEMLQKEIHLDALQLDDDTKYFVYLLNFIILWTNNGEEWVEPDCKKLWSLFDWILYEKRKISNQKVIIMRKAKKEKRIKSVHNYYSCKNHNNLFKNFNFN
jgi:hypothetical protein